MNQCLTELIELIKDFSMYSSEYDHACFYRFEEETLSLRSESRDCFKDEGRGTQESRETSQELV